MFKEMRKKERETSMEEAIGLLEKGEYGVLSTIGFNGYPYGVPMSYSLLNNVLYFHCALEGQKLINLKHNNKASFCVVGYTEVMSEKFSTKYESVIVFGRVSIVTEEEKREGLIALLKKYSKDFIDKGIAYINNDIDKTVVFKLEIEHISGKKRN